MVIEPLGNNIYVLRDDMLAGGTKSVLMPHTRLRWFSNSIGKLL